jgi:hypothetical protein
MQAALDPTSSDPDLPLGFLEEPNGNAQTSLNLQIRIDCVGLTALGSRFSSFIPAMKLGVTDVRSAKEIDSATPPVR